MHKGNSKMILCGLIVASGLALGVAQAPAADGIISRTEVDDGSYCHLRFPAIVPSTLGTDRPQLKSPSSGDIIDYYGACDHDPLSKEEVAKQEIEQRTLRDYHGGSFR
jgi:hypothetical protein